MKRLLLTVTALVLSACADEAITPAHLDADGALRNDIAQQSSLTSSGSQTRFATAPAAAIDAVLARESGGALEDDTDFTADVGRIHLHLRTSGLAGARPVSIRWIREDVTAAAGQDVGTSPAMSTVEHDGVLQPSDKMVWADALDVRPGDVGAWRVEIRGITASAPLLYERHFVIRNPGERASGDRLNASAVTPASP